MTIRVTDDTTRHELAEAIDNLNRSAKRAQHIVEKFSDDEPTEWTRWHRRIDALLEDWMKAPA